MDIQEIQNTLDELEIELKKALVDASPSTSFVLKTQNLLLKNQMPMMLGLMQQNEAMQKQNDGLQHQLETMQKQNDGLQHQLDAMQKQNDALQHQLNAMQKQNDALQHQLNAMQKQNETLVSTIKDLQETIKELKCKLGKDSHNSSKPSSSNPFKKPKSLREKTGRKPGGQKGHSGSHMRIPHEPDNVVLHVPDKCKTCPFLNVCLQSQNAFSSGEKRYEVNVEIKTIVTEHQVLEVKECNCGCLKGTKGEFPTGLKAYVQYGNSFAVLATMLSTYGAVSYNRIAQMIRNITGVSLSEGTLTSMVERCSLKVEGALDKIKEILQGSKVVHFDETGVRVNSKMNWVHNSSSEKYTYLTVNTNRGYVGMLDNGVLPEFNGIAVHDCWYAYFKFKDTKHAICCVHLLRDLNSIIENEKNQTWATKFKEFLLKWLKIKKEAIENKEKRVELPEKIKNYEIEYDEILQLADKEFPMLEDTTPKKRGKKKMGKIRALIHRLKKFKDEVSYFIRDLDVPFDNNQAERDVRNVKTKSKVAGCFRSLAGAKNYVNIMSYIGTAAKNGIDSFTALSAAFEGNADIIFSEGSE